MAPSANWPAGEDGPIQANLNSVQAVQKAQQTHSTPPWRRSIARSAAGLDHLIRPYDHPPDLQPPDAVAAPAQQQSELALQGNLFGSPEPAALPRLQAPEAEAAVPETPQLEAADLEADAASRPRRRRTPGTPHTNSPSQPDDPSSPNPPPASPEHQPDSDLPPWHHHSLVQPEQLTPMLRHYVELKAAHPERVLLYRLGDFFECFFEDAITLSRLLELTLTGKEGGKAIGRVPMAGIPHHAAERYCGELVRRGLSVALCDQLEDASSRGGAKGELLKRGITRVLTPGTVLDDEMLPARRNNWLCAVVMADGARWGLAVADVSTGEFRVTERSGSDQLHQELLQVEAAEVLWPALESAKPAWCPEGLHLTPLPRTPFEGPEASSTLKTRFDLASLDGLGLGDLPLAMRAAGGLVAYLDGTQEGQVPLDLPTT
ncbi:MAG: hypothetical protein EBZ76_10810, partial [Synechococcaceae bacterium WB9_2_170]|nr:hypothetical protein [Synechococcaceae bacterium WB9_2_170]